tara:strand:- start:191 stop:742 length:552 start_codon:yes stop_codon:yes gene_type:complete
MNRTRKNKSKLKECIYNDNHFTSNDGMLTTVWGPGMWHFLHTTSFNYPNNPTKDDILHYKNFIINLKYILPCGKCRDNFSEILKKYPLINKHMKNRESFSRYVYNLHEEVNKNLNKKSNLSYNDVRQTYEHFRARCSLTTSNKEKGCTEPLHGEKSKCILHIVPVSQQGNTLQIDEKCLKKIV